MIQRYSIDTEYGIATMEHDESGRWVRHEDHLAALSGKDGWESVSEAEKDRSYLVWSESGGRQIAFLDAFDNQWRDETGNAMEYPPELLHDLPLPPSPERGGENEAQA